MPISSKTEFKKKWLIANVVAMLVAYSLYTPIAHGFTGSHGRDLTTNQIILHCIALTFVGLVIFGAQRLILRKYLRISSIRIIISIIGFITLFWVGYYWEALPAGPDYDILFAFMVLGTGIWISHPDIRGGIWIKLITILSFPLASFIGELILFLTVIGFNIEMKMQEGLLHHTIFWLVVGLFTGLIGGWISGITLSKMINEN